MYGKLTGLAAGACLLALSGVAHGATATLNPTADGDVQTFGGDDVNTVNTVISFTQSGGLVRNGVLEFDLSSIADGSTITGVSLDLTLARFVSNIGTSAEIDVFAYAGDGVVDISDFSGGTQVFDGSTPTGGNAGDVRSFALTDFATFESMLAANLLTLRLETDSFASFQIGSLESTSLAAASLTVDYIAAATSDVPLPAALPLLAVGLAGLGFAARRRS